jgi:hypothetical protein
MQESNHKNDDEGEDEEDLRNKTEAGIARGAVRSLARSAARFPAVGRIPVARPVVLPRPVPMKMVMPRRLPVKQVAKISDRMSQGLDLYDSAAESSANQSHLVKLGSFASSKSK